MDHDLLKKTAREMVDKPRGLLAADESSNTANKRFDAVNVEKTEENRRLYRQLLFKTPKLEKYINGVILYDETFWQSTDEGQPLREYLAEKGIMPGIKVDMGLIDLPGFPGEHVSQGLDGLPERMEKYAENGAKFAKWRSAISLEGDLPTHAAIAANVYVLARYARICQEHNIVPMVEPETLFEGKHSIDKSEETVKKVLDALFHTMKALRVDMEGAVLKTSMVLPGKDSGSFDSEDIAERTSKVLKEHVPDSLGGVVFLSGGQTPKQAMINLDEIEERGPYSWGLTFSYSRALQDPVLKQWASDMKDVEKAQTIFAQQLQYATMAAKGGLEESDIKSSDFTTEGQD